MALAVYPIAKSNFSMHDAPPLSEENFSSVKNFQAQIDQLENYTHYIRMSFSDINRVTNIVVSNLSSSGKNQSRNP